MAAGGHGVNFVELVASGLDENLASGILMAGVVCAAGLAARARLAAHPKPIQADANLTLRNFFELVSTFVLRLGDNVLGHENRKYLPFVATIFFYVLCMNFLGIIPGFSMPTDSPAFNAGIALTVFVLYNAWGIKEVGLKAYIKHFCLWDQIRWLGIPVLFIEVISHLVRPLSLTLRLYGNMTGDHMVLSVFTELAPWGIPVVFYVLGTIVCFMQAFVFTLLTMLYIRFAVAHEEGGH